MSDPAFPNGPDITGGQFAPHGGMTQRQYYKAQALAGLLANPAVVMYKNNGWMLNGGGVSSGNSFVVWPYGRRYDCGGCPT